MKRTLVAAATVGLTLLGTVPAALSTTAAPAALPRPAAPAGPDGGSTALVGRAVLPADTFRPGSLPSGAFFSARDRDTARANGVDVAATGAALPAQPVQGFSALVPTERKGEFFALADNGFGGRGNSADFLPWVYRVRPDLRRGADAPGPVTVSRGFGLSDPAGHIPWRIACDPAKGAALPPFDVNALPAQPPAACGDPRQRRLTGFDVDPESMQVGRDGTLWFGDEFGPFLLHTDARGRLLEAPIALPGVTSPQNPTLRVTEGERPTLASSRGFEGLGISPDRRTLYPLLEGPVSGDDPRHLRLYRFDIRTRSLQGYDLHRLELPGAPVNTSTLRLANGDLAYPGDKPPAANLGKTAIGEFTLLNSREAVVIERDNGGDAPTPARFKKLYRVTLPEQARRAVLPKQMLVDLMAVPDPDGTGGDGDFFRFPYTTIESVVPLDQRHLLLVNDNNYPFSNGRSFSRGATAGNGLRADHSEFIEVEVSGGLRVDPRTLRTPRG